MWYELGDVVMVNDIDQFMKEKHQGRTNMARNHRHHQNHHRITIIDQHYLKNKPRRRLRKNQHGNEDDYGEETTGCTDQPPKKINIIFKVGVG